MYHLKPIPVDAVDAALAKAERYRLLNEGAIAESICDDVLALNAGHQPALVMKMLAITDQFLEEGIGQRTARALDLVSRLETAYDRAYYEGIVHERRGRAHLGNGGPAAGGLAYDSFETALSCFARAIDHSPPGTADAVLRWNACVRTLRHHPELQPQAREPEAVIESE